MTLDELERQLRHGMDMARDPRNAHVRGPDDLRVTTVYSPWLLQLCRVCRHTFREADCVRTDTRYPKRMIHDDEPSNLRCLGTTAQRCYGARARLGA